VTGQPVSSVRGHTSHEPPRFYGRRALVLSGCDLVARGLAAALRDLGFSLDIHQALPDPQSKPHLILLDDGMLAQHGLDLIHGLVRQYPRTGIILVSSRTDHQAVWSAMIAGVSGYLYLNDPLLERLPGALDDVLRGAKALSPTPLAVWTQTRDVLHTLGKRLNDYHLTVLRLMVEGLPPEQIAAQIGRTTTAVYNIQRYLRATFKVETNGQVVHRALQFGVLDQLERDTARLQR
jgi:DNA-binding NarL/FixJ family response regulator